MVQHKIVRGKAKYGIYSGDIHNESVFAGRIFTHHGWIERTKTIVDPTRWVFEAQKPYIFIGSIEEYRKEYDFGGNDLKERLRGNPPPYNHDSKSWQTPKNLKNIIQGIIKSNSNKICIEQIMYLANTPFHQLGSNAKPLYKWIASIHLESFIPIDNRIEVLGVGA